MSNKNTTDEFVKIYANLTEIESLLVSMKRLMVFITIDNLPTNKQMYDRVNQFRDKAYFLSKEVRARLQKIDGLENGV